MKKAKLVRTIIIIAYFYFIFCVGFFAIADSWKFLKCPEWAPLVAFGGMFILFIIAFYVAIKNDLLEPICNEKIEQIKANLAGKLSEKYNLNFFENLKSYHYIKEKDKSNIEFYYIKRYAKIKIFIEDNKVSKKNIIDIVNYIKSKKEYANMDTFTIGLVQLSDKISKEDILSRFECTIALDKNDKKIYVMIIPFIINNKTKEIFTIRYEAGPMISNYYHMILNFKTYNRCNK